MTSLFRRLAVLPTLLVLAGLSTALHAQPKNVILYIGDGFGIAPKTAARMALGQGRDGKRFSTDAGFHAMQLDALRYNSTITTHSLNSWITDSAPGAACYAVGQRGKIDNEFISMDPVTMEALPTILEAAKRQGYAVGLVTTTRITHATPAVFGSHIWNRDLEDYIAAQYISSTEAEYESIFTGGDSNYVASRDWQLPTPKVGVEIDVLLGGGSRHFLPKAGNGGAHTIVRDRAGNPILGPKGDTVRLGKGRRVDNADLVTAAEGRGFRYVNSRDALLGLDLSQFTPSGNAKLLGLFRDSHCDYEQDRQMTYPWEPTLAEMTEIAIKVLKRKSPKGFFLMVEAGRIDHLEHANCGGIGFTADLKNYVVTADKPAIAEDLVYNADTSKIVPNVYGSDYMIKEVLAYDYAVGVGRALLSEDTTQTLILATSDHECGGFAVVGLHDEENLSGNGTKIRTYANTPKKPVFTPTPVNVTRGDVATNGWYPDYVMTDFQGRMWPQVGPSGRRIVVSYGSNPVTNGNGGAVGSTPGNHTPQDVLIYADDNVNGTVASTITGRGLLDNTDLAPIMEKFLNVKIFAGIKSDDDPTMTRSLRVGDVIPNPTTAGSSMTFEFTTEHAGAMTVAVYNSIGQRVRLLVNGLVQAGRQTVTWDTLNDQGGVVPPDVYMISATANGSTLTRKSVVVN